MENRRMRTFETRVTEITGAALASDGIDTIQVSLGLCCNRTCMHCHLEASPERSEMMSWETMEMILDVLRLLGRPLVDITGGSPEMNPCFRRFVAAVRAAGNPIQVRTNLAIVTTPGHDDLPSFFLEHGARLVGSLPCYMEENVDAQRGEGTYAASIEALKRLNAVGYGTASAPPLDLVYNPAGPFLPPEQVSLEAEYKRELMERHGVFFTKLLTMANMPIGRFLRRLRGDAAEREYRDLLSSSFNAATIEGLMCRHQVSVGWDGSLYDCDFNLALGCPVDHGAPNHISRFSAADLANRRIVTGEHCFGCTAGQGSSCGGALVAG